MPIRPQGVVRMLMRVAGICMVLVGAVLFWLPIPLGAPLLAFGLAVLVASSRTMRRLVRNIRTHRPALDRWLVRLEPLLPTSLALQLRRTRGRRRKDPALSPKAGQSLPPPGSSN